MRPLLIVFVLFPLLELWLLLKLATWIGALPTILYVVGSALLGGAILRRVGWRTLSLTQLRVRQQASPVPALLDGFLVALAGLLLLLPGLLGDALGLLLLLPPLRRVLWGRWAAGLAPASYGGARSIPDVIEGEYRREP